jgi:hypothetical protein
MTNKKVKHWFKLSEPTQSFLLGCLYNQLERAKKENKRNLKDLTQQAAYELGWGEL